MAAVVKGCRQFDSDVRIKGVILNRVAGPRHENILRTSIEQHCGIPVLGAVPKLGEQYFPERHMGLVPAPEHSWAHDSIAAAADMAKKYLDLEALEKIAFAPGTGKLRKHREAQAFHETPAASAKTAALPKVGIIRDSAFQFYYPENIEAIERAGGDIVFLSPLQDQSIPEIDGLYIGGGFPETHAEELANNDGFRKDLKMLVDKGLPVYAECGGLMYLGEKLVLEENDYPMAGVLPIVYGFSKRPQGHGYTRITVDGDNPYFTKGVEILGHEFHYSKVLEYRAEDSDMVFRMKRGKGLYHGRDGVCYKSVLATYTHIHALGTPTWAVALVGQANAHKNRL